MTITGLPNRFIRSPNFGPKAKTGQWIAVHTAEGSTTASGLGSFFSGNGNNSSHVGIDADEIIQYVDYSEQAYTLRNGNPYSENAELCGFASMSRAEWLSETDVTREFLLGKGLKTVRRPRQMLRHLSAWLAVRCKANKTPITKIGPGDIDAGRSGIIGHVDWTNSNRGEGSHTDPGSNFPWDIVIADALIFAVGGTPSTPPVTPPVTPPRPIPAWPLPRNEYFGLITGPAKSHGGYYAKEREYIKAIQRELIAQGDVPGITNPASGWADGKFEQPTKDAVTRFQRREMPGTTRFGEVWWDDWAQLFK